MDASFNIVWLKRDIRIEDHAAFFEARKRGPIVALYVYEPEYWALPDTSARQWGFIRESLVELEKQLVRLGIPLRVFNGDAVKAFDGLASTGRVASVHAHQETGNFWTFNRDQSVQKTLSRHGINLVEHMQHGVFRCLNTRNGWANRWDAMMGEPGPPLPARQEYPSNLVETLARAGFPDAVESLP
ncbi:MAG: deoxyribodipyrimidine photo-lyase, partial [Pseudomonadota bacterium]